MADATPAPVADTDVLITRVFDAPREAVWRAWTDPDEAYESAGTLAGSGGPS